MLSGRGPSHAERVCCSPPRRRETKGYPATRNTCAVHPPEGGNAREVRERARVRAQGVRARARKEKRGAQRGRAREAPKQGARGESPATSRSLARQGALPGARPGEPTPRHRAAKGVTGGSYVTRAVGVSKPTPPQNLGRGGVWVRAIALEPKWRRTDECWRERQPHLRFLITSGHTTLCFSKQTS